MSASISPVSFIFPSSTPGTFTIATSDPMTDGNCSRFASFSCASVIGASDAPKSTVRFLICVCPAPEPTDW